MWPLLTGPSAVPFDRATGLFHGGGQAT